MYCVCMPWQKAATNEEDDEENPRSRASDARPQAGSAGVSAPLNEEDDEESSGDIREEENPRGRASDARAHGWQCWSLCSSRDIRHGVI